MSINLTTEKWKDDFLMPESEEHRQLAKKIVKNVRYNKTLRTKILMAPCIKSQERFEKINLAVI